MENFDFIRGKGKHFIAALKDNRLVALSEEDRKKKRFVRVDELDFPEQTAVQGWLKGSAQAVLFECLIIAIDDLYCISFKYRGELKSNQ